MTSRFYKTYSRKGGDGTSKFDEVFSNKKTMSTKWGETTYRAKLTSKRPGLSADRSELSKRSRLADDDSSEDPFGFDSDEESRPKPVSSRSSGGAGSSNQNRLSPVRAERPPSLTLEPNSRVSQPASVEAVAPSRGPSGLGSDRSSLRVPEDPSRIFSSNSLGKREAPINITNNSKSPSAHCPLSRDSKGNTQTHTLMLYLETHLHSLMLTQCFMYHT